MPLVNVPDHIQHQFENETKKIIDFIERNYHEYSDNDIINILSQALLSVLCTYILYSLEEENFNADHEIDDFFKCLKENFLNGIQNIKSHLENQDV